MKGRRQTPEQIVRKLREADRLLAEGADVSAVCRPPPPMWPPGRCCDVTSTVPHGNHPFKGSDARRPNEVPRNPALQRP